MNEIVVYASESADYPAFVLCEECDELECVICRDISCEGCPSPYTNGES